MLNKWPFLPLLLLQGCISQSHFVSDQAYMTTVEASLEAMKSYIELIEKGYVNYKHDYQRRLIKETMDSFWIRHTDENGGAVSVDAEGNVIPMPVDQIKSATASIELKFAEVVKSEITYQDMKKKITEALSELSRITIQHRDGTISDSEVIFQAQAVVNSLVGAFSTIGVAAVGGGL